MDDTASYISANTSARIPTQLPMHRKLEEIYKQNSGEYRQRFEKIKKRFKDFYGGEISYMVRVPGIAKLPLEQIDIKMFDYGVACLEQDVVVAIGVVEGQEDLKIGNIEKAKFPVVERIKKVEFQQRFFDEL